MKIHLSIINSPENIEMLAEALTFLATNPEARYAAATVITEHAEIPQQGELGSKVEDTSLWYWGGDDGKTYILDLPDDWRDEAIKNEKSVEERLPRESHPWFCSTDKGEKIHVGKPASDHTWCGRWVYDHSAAPHNPSRDLCRNCVKNQSIHGDEEVAEYLSSLL